jgi:hypothetical protein
MRRRRRRRRKGVGIRIIISTVRRGIPHYRY